MNTHVIVEQCGNCAPCRVGQRLACTAMKIWLPDGTAKTAKTDEAVVASVKAWFKATGVKFTTGLIEWREGTGYSIFKGPQHEAVECKRLLGLHLQYATKNWSDAFECPTCKTRKRYSLNFLGSKKVMCDGKRFTKVED